MKRNEYRLLVENWNNFLIEEEARLKKNALLSESIRLNENKLKRIAKRLSVTLPTLVLALTAFANGASAKEVKANPNAYTSGYATTMSIKNGDITDAATMLKNGSAKQLHDSLQSKKEQKRVALKKIGEKIQKIQDKAGGKKVITYVLSFYSRITLTYLTYLKSSPKQIKEIKEKTQELLEYFQGKKFNKSETSGSFSKKIKKLREIKDVRNLKKLATTIQLFVTCGSSLEQCVEKLNELTKSGETLTQSEKLQGSVGFSDGDEEHFVEVNFNKVIFNPAIGAFESDVDNLIDRIFDDETPDSEFSDIEITLIEGLLNEDGTINLDLLDGLSGYVDVMRGGDNTNIDAELKRTQASNLSFSTKDGVTTQTGIKNPSKVATDSNVEVM